MKILNVILVSMMLVVTLSISAESNVHVYSEGGSSELLGRTNSPAGRATWMWRINRTRMPWNECKPMDERLRFITPKQTSR